jgi:hypothetical protein
VFWDRRNIYRHIRLLTSALVRPPFGPKTDFCHFSWIAGFDKFGAGIPSIAPWSMYLVSFKHIQAITAMN